MSDEATIEDELEVDEPTVSTRPETNTGLLKWSYIFEMATKNWMIFLLISIAIGVYLYVNGRRRRNARDASSAIRHDHVQGGSKGVSRSPRKQD